MRPSTRAAIARRRGVPGDPSATRSAILKVVDAEEPPLRIFFGKVPIEIADEGVRVAPGAVERVATRFGRGVRGNYLTHIWSISTPHCGFA